jgi:hypothetical protein
MVLSTSAPGTTALTQKPTPTTAKTATVSAKKTSAGTKGSADERGENTSMTGFIFDTVSEMTVPSIDQVKSQPILRDALQCTYAVLTTVPRLPNGTVHSVHHRTACSAKPHRLSTWAWPSPKALSRHQT